MAKKRGQKSSGPAPTHPYQGEIRGLLFLTLAILILLSLSSFAYGQPSSNWLGVLGYTVGGLFHYALGLSSYVIAIFLGWLGCRLLFSQPVEGLTLRALALVGLVLSVGILLSLMETLYPTTAEFFGNRLRTRGAPILRFHLGGAPLYYLYHDLPTFNLHRILNSTGIGLLFSATALASFLILTRLSVLPFLEWISKLWQPVPPAEGTAEPSSLWRNVRLKLGGQNSQAGQANTNTPPEEVLAIRPETELKRRPSLSGKENNRRPNDNPPAPPPSKPPAAAKPRREAAPKAPPLAKGERAYELPPLSLLTDAPKVDQSSIKKDLRRQAEVLEETLQSFGIEAKVGQINCGPTITSFEVHPAIGVKVQKIKALENDIALNMEARTMRIIAPIPGKAAVGIEVPNAKAQEVSFKEMLTFYQRSPQKFRIPVLLGKAVTGEWVMSDLAKMPHCIIAGATGSGKSVCINTIVMSILLNARPDQIRLLMVDPKKVELTPYTALPHMLAPVITEPGEACAALHWLVKEMESRYELLKLFGVRNIEGYNSRKIDPAFEESLNREVPKTLAYYVGIIDELADLMMVASHDIETPIARIAQMARAVGIHLILATQRPSREVITGLIKANFPTRISFKVASRVNSQIVLDEIGAESLLGNGDMLFLPPASSHLTRAQGAYIRDEDIQAAVKFICDQQPPRYLIESFESHKILSDGEEGDKGGKRKGDSLFEQASEIVASTGNASTTFLQRKLKIGYARAASLMDELEESGVIGRAENGKPRKVLRPTSDGAQEEEAQPSLIEEEKSEMVDGSR